MGKNSHNIALQTTQLELLRLTLPFIDGIPLDLLHTAMRDEEDTLTIFRRELANSISTCLASVSDPADATSVRNTAVQVRRDSIEPEIAKLNLAFKRIMRMRTIKVAGASLATIGLAALAICAEGAQAQLPAIAAILGAGGVGVVAKEYSEYEGDVLGLKDNPWYFAWKLKQIAR